MATIPINGDTVLEMWKTARFLKGSIGSFKTVLVGLGWVRILRASKKVR